MGMLVHNGFFYAGSLPKADQKRFPFDSATMDWRYYLQDVHCPAVTASRCRQ